MLIGIAALVLPGPGLLLLALGLWVLAKNYRWADRLLEWEGAGHRVYGYFNNDQFGYAVANAMRLRDLLGR